MTPHGFRSALIAIGAVAGLLTLSLYGAIFGLLCVAWLCVRSTPPSHSDKMLEAISDGKLSVKKLPGLTDE